MNRSLFPLILAGIEKMAATAVYSGDKVCHVPCYDDYRNIDNDYCNIDKQGGTLGPERDWAGLSPWSACQEAQPTLHVRPYPRPSTTRQGRRDLERTSKE